MREGVSGISLGTHATQEDGGLVKTLLKSLGIAEMVDEKYLDAISGLSGSGPAYVCVLDIAIDLSITTKLCGL